MWAKGPHAGPTHPLRGLSTARSGLQGRPGAGPGPEKPPCPREHGPGAGRGTCQQGSGTGPGLRSSDYLAAAAGSAPRVIREGGPRRQTGGAHAGWSQAGALGSEKCRGARGVGWPRPCPPHPTFHTQLPCSLSTQQVAPLWPPGRAQRAPVSRREDMAFYSLERHQNPVCLIKSTAGTMPGTPRGLHCHEFSATDPVFLRVKN